MLRHNMTVITKDNRLKREVQRVTASTASNAEFILDVAALDRVQKPDLVIFDARTTVPPRSLTEKLGTSTAIIFIVEEENLIESMSLLGDGHATSVMGHGARFDDDEFIASATKALRGNVFGLQKYFPWGVTTFSVVVASGAQKSKAIEIILQYASLAGLRGPVRDRVQTVADELMMNALYHAPVDKDGKELFAGRTLKELSQLPEVPAIEVSYGSSGRYFGISVRDGGGSLTRTRALQYLAKAKTAQADIEQKIGGAGLGLVSTLRSVSKLVFNLDPGRSTEVIGLFDMELFAKGKVGARSVHVFSATPTPEPEAATRDDEDEAAAAAAAEPPVPSVTGARWGMWVMAAILLSVVTALGTAVVMNKTKGSGAAGDKCPPAGDATAAPTEPAPPAPAPPTAREPAPPAGAHTRHPR
jgi:hypothetical protein